MSFNTFFFYFWQPILNSLANLGRGHICEIISIFYFGPEMFKDVSIFSSGDHLVQLSFCVILVGTFLK